MSTIFAVMLITGVVIMFADGIRGCLKFFVGSFLITIASMSLFDDGILVSFLAIVGMAVYLIFLKRRVV